MKFVAVFLFAVLSIALARDPRCPENDTYLLPFPHDDCTKFYQCDVGGVAWEFQCDPELVFDPASRVCIN